MLATVVVSAVTWLHALGRVYFRKPHIGLGRYRVFIALSLFFEPVYRGRN